MKILAFGEILFDVCEDTKKIGGAPLNFASHCAALGEEVYILSAVGNDDLGKTATDFAKKMGVNTKYIQISDKKTGICNITYKNGEPNYDLSMISAYDYIENPEIDDDFDVLYFGTLAQRSETSKNTLKKIIENTNFKTIFFDMNLRQNYHSNDLIKDGLSKCNILKINREEFQKLEEILNTKDVIGTLKSNYKIDLIMLTLDKDGAKIYHKDEVFEIMAEAKKVVSTVGAGDSFCACFLSNFLNGTPISLSLKRANILSAYVVERIDAIPKYNKELKERLSSAY